MQTYRPQLQTEVCQNVDDNFCCHLWQQNLLDICICICWTFSPNAFTSNTLKLLRPHFNWTTWQSSNGHLQIWEWLSLVSCAVAEKQLGHCNLHASLCSSQSGISLICHQRKHNDLQPLMPRTGCWFVNCQIKQTNFTIDSSATSTTPLCRTVTSIS